ncbi:protein rogdi-like [Babylonia areolata]|uniref:protein rogdi-like n=1 Tax=Babylonia areolata TaxID=304850 RepID=UPI003FD017C7
MAEEGVEAEKFALKQELRWLLKEEAHATLDSIQRTLKECCKCFPLPIEGVNEGGDVPEHDVMVSPAQRLLLSGATSTSPSTMKCMVSLHGDSISQADIRFKHKEKGKDSQNYKTAILPDRVWKLQQIQDAANHLEQALQMVSFQQTDLTFTTPHQLLILLERLNKSVLACRHCLSIPKRKSLQELVFSKTREIFNPPIPQNVALSFYIHGSKVILAIYLLHMNGQQRMDVSQRLQMEAEVQWLKEAVILFSVASQQCQQLADKITTVCQCGGLDLKTQVA